MPKIMAKTITVNVFFVLNLNSSAEFETDSKPANAQGARTIIPKTERAGEWFIEKYGFISNKYVPFAESVAAKPAVMPTSIINTISI